jgi:hypothetical protein
MPQTVQPVVTTQPATPALPAETLETASRTQREHAEDKTDLPVLLTKKREEFLRVTIRTTTALLAQIEKKVGAAAVMTDPQLKTLVKMLADLVDIVRGPLAFESGKPEPKKRCAVQVNILNQILEEADREAGKQGRSPTGEKTIEL